MISERPSFCRDDPGRRIRSVLVCHDDPLQSMSIHEEVSECRSQGTRYDFRHFLFVGVVLPSGKYLIQFLGGLFSTPSVFDSERPRRIEVFDQPRLFLVGEGPDILFKLINGFRRHPHLSPFSLDNLEGLRNFNRVDQAGDKLHRSLTTRLLIWALGIVAERMTRVVLLPISQYLINAECRPEYLRSRSIRWLCRCSPDTPTLDRRPFAANTIERHVRLARPLW